jgi:hypothetical protein
VESVKDRSVIDCAPGLLRSVLLLNRNVDGYREHAEYPTYRGKVGRWDHTRDSAEMEEFPRLPRSGLSSTKRDGGKPMDCAKSTLSRDSKPFKEVNLGSPLTRRPTPTH